MSQSSSDSQRQQPITAVAWWRWGSSLDSLPSNHSHVQPIKRESNWPNTECCYWKLQYLAKPTGGILKLHTENLWLINKIIIKIIQHSQITFYGTCKLWAEPWNCVSNTPWTHTLSFAHTHCWPWNTMSTGSMCLLRLQLQDCVRPDSRRSVSLRLTWQADWRLLNGLFRTVDWWTLLRTVPV